MPYIFASFFLALILAWVTHTQPYKNGPPIRSDGMGYHLWTHMFKAQDFGSCRYASLIGSYKTAGECTNKYPSGVAVLRLPIMWFLVDADRNPVHVGPKEHQVVLLLGAVLLLVIFGQLSQVASWLGVNSVAAALTIISLIFGTGLFHYSTYDASYVHIYNAFFISTWVWIFARRKFKNGKINKPLMAALACLMILTRSTNLLAILFLAGIFMNTFASRKERLVWVSYLTVGVGLGTLLLMFSNKLGSGSFSISGYGTESFLWNRPMLTSVLFSYERGVFTYYPVLMVPLILGFSIRKARAFSLGLCSLFIAYAALYGFWHKWTLGGGFGHRGFVLLVPLACFLYLYCLRFFARKRQIMLATVACLLMVPSMLLMQGYWQGSIHFGGTKSSRYWDHLKLVYLLGSTSSSKR